MGESRRRRWRGHAGGVSEVKSGGLAASRAQPSPLVGEGRSRQRRVRGEGSLLAQTKKHHQPISARLRTNARRMRHSSTAAELAMWRLLRDRSLSSFKFRRQAPVENFILVFVCFDRRIVVEIDGSQHANSTLDAERDGQLAAAGFQTIRYWNNDVLMHPTSVLEDLLARMTEAERNPSPGASLRLAPPSPAKGEGKSARGKR